MATVAIVAVALATTRAESALWAMIIIVAACISYLASIRYSETMSLRQARGLMTSRSQKARILLASVTISAVVIGLSDLAFLTGYYVYLRVGDVIILESHATPSVTPRFMASGWIFGLILALCVASSLRRTIWIGNGREPWRTRRWLKLWWPVGLWIVIGVLLVADHLWQRYSFCTMMAEYHAMSEEKASDSKEAALHAWLRQWHRRAAICPWLPVDPPHPPQSRGRASQG